MKKKIASTALAVLSAGVLLGATGTASAAPSPGLQPPTIDAASQPPDNATVPGGVEVPRDQTASLRTRVLTEWNAAGRRDCALRGCQWLGYPWLTLGETRTCEVHHIIPQNDPNAAVARYYAAYGGYSTEMLANGVYLQYTAHKKTFVRAYTAYQEARFRAFAEAPNGRTPAGARFYTGLYLAEAKKNLYNSPIPNGTRGGCYGTVFWPAR